MALIDISSRRELFDVCRAYWYNSVVAAALKLNLFENIEKGNTDGWLYVSTQDLVLLQNNEEFLDCLVQMGLIEKTIEHCGVTYENTELTKHSLLKSSNFYIGDIILHNNNIMKLSLHLDECIRNEIPILEKSSDIDYKTLLKGLDEIKPKEFDLNFKWLRADQIENFTLRDVLDHSKIKLDGLKLLDIGAGSGRFSNIIHEKYPELDITALEDKNYDYLELYPKINSIHSNFFDYSIKTYDRYDFIFISEVLHGKSKEDIEEILKESNLLLNKYGIIIIREQTKDLYISNVFFSMNMQLCTNQGKAFYNEEIISYLKNSKFRIITIQDSEFGYTYIVGGKID